MSASRKSFGLAMLGATLAALALGVGVSAAMGGGWDAGRSVVVALAAGSFLTFIPALVPISREYWGVGVLFCGATRGLVVIGLAYALSGGEGGPERRPVMVGSASGAGLLLAVETALAVVLLSRLERAREASRRGDAVGGGGAGAGGAVSGRASVMPAVEHV
ncbi:MAG: hypothetical protein HRU70_06905 [Phycisphaeraceae bacterium]|nr:MAG: hypothetical protein HRU70_06905 [Phycisphaeraceae bacterium]